MINFPTPSQLGELYSQNGQSWQWDGSGWNSYGHINLGPTGPTGTNVAGPSGATGPIGVIGVTGPTGSLIVPKITNIEITDNSYSVIDDTAVDSAGGYIRITGTGFTTGCQLLVGNTPALATTYVSSTEVRAQVPAMTAGIYNVYLVSATGEVAIRAGGLTCSAFPSWNTASALTQQIINQTISIQLSSTDAVSYALASDSTLPSGLTLSPGGLLSGTVTGLSGPTVYSFTVVATDAENQNSSRTFSVTITMPDVYFKYTTLLLSGDGQNGANNSVFTDSSANNLAITRNGNPTQGSFSPYSPTGWSVYFDGSGDYLILADNDAFNFGTTDFTIECWIYWIKNPTGSNNPRILCKGDYQVAEGAWRIQVNQSTGALAFGYGLVDTTVSIGSAANQSWTHVAVTRSSGTLSTFNNGALIASAANFVNFTTPSLVGIGSGTQSPGTSEQFMGYISNVRMAKGTAFYSGNFTPSTTPFTSTTSNIKLLACQSNRLVDDSSNAFTITRYGDARVTNFGPDAPNLTYSADAHSGSGYFDGTGDYLSLSAAAPLTIGGEDFTLETWLYITSTNSQIIFDMRPAGGNGPYPCLYYSNGNLRWYVNTSDRIISSPINLNCWYHVAICRSGSVTLMFVNGVQVLTTYADSNNYQCSRFFIGMSAYDGTSSAFNGYISDARLVKGTAIYNSNFAPPAAPLTAITNTSILLKFVGAGLVDATTRNILETVGGAQVSTAIKRHGVGSMYFNGTDSYLAVTNSKIVGNFITGDFTVECWIYPLSTATSNIIDFRGTTGTAIALRIAFGPYGSTSNKIVVGWTTDVQLTSSSALSTGQWYHIAVSRTGSTVKLFINGVESQSLSDSPTILDDGMIIGSYKGNTAYYNGYIDDLRITRGIGRYTTNFTPPGQAFSLR